MNSMAVRSSRPPGSATVASGVSDRAAMPTKCSASTPAESRTAPAAWRTRPFARPATSTAAAEKPAPATADSQTRIGSQCGAACSRCAVRPTWCMAATVKANSTPPVA